VPQTLWVLGVTLLIVLALWRFFGHSLLGKAFLATSHNRLAAQLVGIDTSRVMVLSFALSAALGAVGGILIAPISLTSADVGVMLGLKGFSAAILGGLGNAMGAVAGGLILGIVEALGAGYVSSAYKDAIAFAIILLVLFFRPQGLFGQGGTERV
jgi:branched-chain amino acid transport system permease protein